MKKYIIMITILLYGSGCAIKVNEKGPIVSKASQDSLVNFFRACESDMKNSLRIISERDLIKTLTHFQRFNPGGKKYYLLERESLSAMIQSVTRGLYEDFILINKHGVVVYTRTNDTIFAQSTRGTLRNTPLYDCFTNATKEIYIRDISDAPIISDNLNLFIASRVYRDDSFQGVFILQVAINKIEKLISQDSFILDNLGNFKVSKNRHLIFNQFPHFGKIKIISENPEGARQHKTEDRKYSYYTFNYKNLSWIIVTEL